MSKSLNKANGIVDKATSVFGETIEKVNDANEILRQSIKKDTIDNDVDLIKIEELKEKIESRDKEKSNKLSQIEENNGLIDRLKMFVSK